MKLLKLSKLLAFIMILIGISGNAMATTKVACMGGMRTFGIGASDFVTKSYPGVLATLLGEDYEVERYGVGNRTILHKGTEKDPAVESSPIPCAFLDHGTLNTVANSKADIIFIDLGEMDAKPWNWAYKDEFASDFTEIVERIRKGSPDSKICVCLPPRLRNNNIESGIDGNVYINEVVPALRAVAEELGLPILDNTDILKDDATLYSGSYNLTDAGHATVAAALYKFITGKEAPHPTRVACMGNSITAGATINNNADKYPSVLQQLLGEGYEVRNYGQNSQTVQMHGRDTAEDSKDGDCAYRNKDTYRNALAFMPEIVVIKLGTNDSKNVNWREDSPEIFRKDLCDMLDEIKENSNPKIYLALPIRVKREDWTINEKNIHIIIDILKDVAEERGLDVINLHTAFDEEFGDDWDTVYNDGVHPDTTGAAVIANRVADAILNGNLGSESVTHPMRTIPVISCMGGMRTFGNTLADRNTEAYPALLQKIFAENDTEVRVTNAGVGNRTVLAEGNERADGSAPCGFIKNDQFRTKVTELAPDIVTIDLGDKDATAWNWGTLKDSFHSDYTDIINAIKDSNPSVKIYVCIPPRILDDANAANVDGVMLRDEVIPAIRLVADANKVNLLDLNEVMTPDCYHSDKYHLNAKGHEAVARRIYDEIHFKDDISTETTEIILPADAISKVYFDLTGRIVSNPSAGIYIVKTTFSNGETISEKMVVNALYR
ncbi:MAG: hypothetical protein HDS43_01215 [Bacteroides sp.]|nr:hypothetical protein [Bacteroides sp.]